MTAFSKINMAEVTRLTRAGKLAEATAMLQGNYVPGPEDQTEPSSTAPALSSQASIDGSAGAASKAGSAAGFVKRLLDFRTSSPGRNFSGAAQRPSSRRAPAAIPAGAIFEERIFSNQAGSRNYKVFAPSDCEGQALPVVVMLHGCTQDPDDFAAGTQMNALAQEQKFLVVYPRQPQAANAQKCWNWFNVGDQQRGQGEPSLIAGIALQVVEDFAADPRRVYVAGLSAGGAAAAIMAATYPDVFAAVGVHSGLACGAARDVPSAFAAMGGKGVARSRGAGPTVPTIVFHGDADKTVHLHNSEQVVAQATPPTAVNKAVTRGESAGGRSYTRIEQRDAEGRVIVEQWVLHGAGHAWSGGSPEGTYTDPSGPEASREMVRFFLSHTVETTAEPRV